MAELLYGSHPYGSLPYAGSTVGAPVTSGIHTRAELEILVGGVDQSAGYRMGTLKKKEGLGGTPNEFSWETTTQPSFRDEVIVTASYLDEAGGLLKTKRFFAGHVIDVEQLERAQQSGKVKYRVRTLDYRWDANFRTFSSRYRKQRANASIIEFVVRHLSARGYTTNGVEQGSSEVTGPFDLQEIHFTEFATDLARQAGMAFSIDYFKDVQFYDFGSRPAPRPFDRATGDFANFKWREQIDSLVNNVIVFGQDGLFAEAADLASVGLYGVHRTSVSMTSVTDKATLNRVVTAILASRSNPIKTCSFRTSYEDLEPGQTLTLDYNLFGVTDQQVQIRALSWRQDKSGRIHCDVEATTQVELPVFDRAAPDGATPPQNEPELERL